jgi:hypothetical protein
MGSMASAFSVQGTGSVANIRGSNIETNVIADKRWVGINAQGGASVNLSNATFTGNSGAQSLVSSVGAGTTVSATSVSMTDDVGGLEIVSALCFLNHC